MIHILYSLIKLPLGPLFATALLLTATVGQSQVLDVNSGLATVAELQRNGQSVLELEPYSADLVRSYFRNFPMPESEPQAADQGKVMWRLNGLLAYGTQADLPDAVSMLKYLPTFYGWMPKAELEMHIELMPLVIPARLGDDTALERLSAAPVDLAVYLLSLCRSEKARDRLVELAMDDRIEGNNCVVLLRSLRQLGDPRCLSIALSDEVFAKLRRSGADPWCVWVDATGDSEFHHVKTPQEARELAKQKGIQITLKRVKVRGEIDWATFTAKTAGRTEAAPKPIQSSDMKIPQPKPEKPAAAAPTPKPPASNASALIAAGAAIVGLLAVLIWFLRKK